MDEPLPYEQLFYPLVLTASEQLNRQADPAIYRLLSPEAHAGWQRYLLSRLTSAGARAAHWQFEIFKTIRPAFPEQQHRRQEASDLAYQQFVGAKPSERLRKLFDEFPVLGSWCSELAELWLTTVTGFLRHLSADRHDLADHLGRRTSLVVGLQAGLSDPHHGGRCVVRLAFEGGARIIFKPRSIAPEAAFARLIDQLNDEQIPFRLRAARSWDRGDHSWMENIEPKPCTTRSDVQAFYWRAGALLGLVHLAKGVDIHRENLIAVGESPVLIDLEALWHPQHPEKSRQLPAASTVLRTGFLPHGALRSNKTYEWGALSRDMHVERPSTTAWVNVNQDNMDLVPTRSEFPSQSHLPTVDGTAHLATEYLPEIQAGFRWIGEALLENSRRRKMLGRWLGLLRSCKRRLLLRSTAQYHFLLERLTSPNYLREYSAREALLVGTSTRIDLVRAHEIQALERFDIPYFAQPPEKRVTRSDCVSQLPSIGGYLAQLPIIAETFASAPR